MPYLAKLGTDVTGVDCVPRAYQEFKRLMKSSYNLDLVEQENSITKDYQTHFVEHGTGSITYLIGDFFGIGRAYAEAVKFDGIYDRGSLVAVRPEDRKEYVDNCVAALKKGGKVLLIALEHDPFKTGKLGPPFCVTREDVEALYGEKCDIKELHRESRFDAEPVWKKKGCSYFDEIIYVLEKKES
eukprot:CAMPEP_0184504808 /NCGR_PEP_ID=MMETSP0113_2-20130426/52656_1 /TAXON_ID=91329 /ORGANISM="Norrisiella sphaerica, Strain BC52" /LENGTH=184 /DNA_ID=CAMNT_0026894467 /DNA_START=589 /DNA_END=1143 /DNA_ORIENTATION=-